MDALYIITAKDYIPIYQKDESSQWCLGKTCEPINKLEPTKILNLKTFFGLWASVYENINAGNYVEHDLGDYKDTIKNLIKNSINNLDDSLFSYIKNKDIEYINLDLISSKYWDGLNIEEEHIKEHGDSLRKRKYYHLPKEVLRSLNDLKKLVTSRLNSQDTFKIHIAEKNPKLEETEINRLYKESDKKEVITKFNKGLIKNKKSIK